jgi:putative peptidoglycan lipid II flippase
VGVLTCLVKIAGGIKVAVTARYFGAGDSLDAFLTAFALPAFFVEVIAGGFAPSFVPALIRVRSQHGEGAAKRLAREGLTLVLAVMVLVTVLLAAASQWVLPVLGSGFSPQKLQVTAALLLGLLVWLPMAACMSSWRAILNAHEVFVIPAAVPLAVPVITMFFLFAGASRWGVYILSIATVVAVIVEFAILAAAVRRLGYPLAPAWTGWNPRLIEIRREYLPLMAATLITSGCLLVDQAVAGSLESGSVSALAYGTRLLAVVFAVGAAAVATALLPEFSRLVAEDAWDRLRNALRANIVVVTGLMLPLLALLIWLAGPMVRIFFERGAFDASATQLVARVQSYSLLQAPFAMLFAILSRLATALSANALIMRAGAAALLVTITGDLLLSERMGVSGIPLAGALAQFVSVSVLGFLLWRREPRLFRAP